MVIKGIAGLTLFSVVFVPGAVYVAKPEVFNFLKSQNDDAKSTQDVSESQGGQTVTNTNGDTANTPSGDGRGTDAPQVSPSAPAEGSSEETKNSVTTDNSQKNTPDSSIPASKASEPQNAASKPQSEGTDAGAQDTGTETTRSQDAGSKQVQKEVTASLSPSGETLKSQDGQPESRTSETSPDESNQGG